MYKQSKFNFHLMNSRNELLLYNCAVGAASMCKLVNPLYQAEYEQKKCISNEAIMKQLIKKGIYVEKGVDENDKLHSIIGRILNPTDLGLSISLTEKCNFSCVYCYESGTLPRMDESIQQSIIDFVRHNIHRYTGLFVNWFGGEPLLEIDTIEKLSKEFQKICSFNKRTYSASITTNGYNLTLDTFHKLLKCNVSDYQVTIDGIKDIHDKQRYLKGGKPTFDKIVNNLKDIKELRQKNFRIVLRSNLTQEIFDVLDDYFDFVSELCSDDARFNLSICYASVWSDTIQESIKDKFIYDRDSIIPLYEKIIEQNKKIYIASSLTPEHGGCQYGKENRYFVRPNGEIHKCSVRFENPKNIIGKLSNGNIMFFDNRFEKICNPRKCKNLESCFYAPICKGEVCPSARTSSDTLCPDTKKHLKYILQICDNNGEFVLLD